MVLTGRRKPPSPLTVLIVVLGMAVIGPAAAQESALPAQGARADQTSISGISSGAFMAAQYHVAHSRELIGVGIIAGGPWNCAASNTLNPFSPRVYNALSTCMNPCKSTWFGCSSSLYPDTRHLSRLAQSSARAGSIDDPSHLLNDQIYLFSGQEDDTVVTGVVDATADFYRRLGVDAERIHYNKEVEAGHAFITDDPEAQSCEVSDPPYINNCGFSQAQRLLGHIYGELQPASDQTKGRLLAFDQEEFTGGSVSSMASLAYVFVPEACRTSDCRLHVALHGCKQGTSELGTDFITGSGYNRVAASNRIIVLYPQAQSSTLNPNGCWDFWGYTGNNLPPYRYYTKRAPQMQAIRAMIHRLTSARTP